MKKSRKPRFQIEPLEKREVPSTLCAGVQNDQGQNGNSQGQNTPTSSGPTSGGTTSAGSYSPSIAGGGAPPPGFSGANHNETLVQDS
jgi:hypothetical protein